MSGLSDEQLRDLRIAGDVHSPEHCDCYDLDLTPTSENACEDFWSAVAAVERIRDEAVAEGRYPLLREVARLQAAERALVERMTALAAEWERENVWLANDVPDPKGGYRSRNRPAWQVIRAALVAVASTDEEPCRCIASGVGGTHYPSDHRPAASGTDTGEGEAS